MSMTKEEAIAFGQEEAKKFFKSHPEYRPSEEMGRVIGDWLKRHNAVFSADNLEKAWASLTRPVSADEFVSNIMAAGVKVE